MSGERSDRSWWERIFGDHSHLGWWTLPVFAAVGLAGAVLAGALAVVYYSQRVAGIEDETRAGREELRQAVDAVREAASEAVDIIQSEVAEVRDRLRESVPLDDLVAHGIVQIRVTVTVPAAPPPPGTAAASPTPAPPATQRRVGSGFAVARDGGNVFYATSYALVADQSAAGAVETVEVVTPAGTVQGRVHSWEPETDLALVQAAVPAPELLLWRPSATPLTVGDGVVAAGWTPQLDPVQLAGRAGLVTSQGVLAGLTVPTALQGGPAVDANGHVVGVISVTYRPWGSGGGSPIVPVQLLCERLLRNCEALEADEPLPSPTPSP